MRRVILKKLDAVEKELGVSMDYLRHILGTSMAAFFKFAKIMPISNYRKVLPVQAYHIARIVATRDEDCGTCVQIEVNMAKKYLSAEFLKAVIDGTPEKLSEDLKKIYVFTKAVVENTELDNNLREWIRERYGEKGLVELSLAIASCRFFPIVKRTLGYSKSCNEVSISF